MLRESLPHSFILRLLHKTHLEWIKNDGPTLAAALSYYTILCLPTFVLISLLLLHYLFGPHIAKVVAVHQVTALVGIKAVHLLQDLSEPYILYDPSHAVAIAIVGFLLAAYGFVAHLNRIISRFSSRPARDAEPITFFRKRVWLLAVSLLSFLVLVSLLLNAGLSIAGEAFHGPDILRHVVSTFSIVVSLSMIILLFAMTYKMVADNEARWSDSLVGGVFAAVMFTLGKAFITGLSIVVLQLGSLAGTVLIAILWIFYASQIFIFGALISLVYARQYEIAN